jgi:hypothetical protein
VSLISSPAKVIQRCPAWRLRRVAVSRLKLGCKKIRIGRAAKKRQLAWIDKVRKQDADMRDLRPVTYRRRRGILPSPVETFC